MHVGDPVGVRGCRIRYINTMNTTDSQIVFEKIVLPAKIVRFLPGYRYLVEFYDKRSMVVSKNNLVLPEGA